MDDLEKRGGHPQKRERDAAGVSLSQTESRFLELLADPFRDDEEFTAAGRAARLTENQIAYIDEWVMNHGAHWLTCESAGFNALEGARVFRNPAVARIINAAAEAGLCAGTIPSKEEVAGFLGQQMRNPFVPAATQQKAAEIPRLYNDHIGLFSVLAVPLRKHLLGFSHEEFGIRESVPFGILPRVLDRCRDDLNTVNLSCLLRKKERDCSDSAVQVPDVLSTGKTGEFQRFAIEAFCLLRIHLVEGKR